MKFPHITFDQVEHTFNLVLMLGAMVFFVVAFIKAVTTKEWK